MWKIIKQGKLGTRPGWDETFMAHAILASSRFSCWKVHSGSNLVYDKRMISTGYNGAPAENLSCMELGECYKEMKTSKSYQDSMNIGVCQGVHSEMNAIFNMSREVPQKSATLYTTVFPCNTCAKNLAGKRLLKKVVFRRTYDDRELESALRIFYNAKVEVCQLELSPERYIDIVFNHRDAVFDAWIKDEKRRILSFLEKLVGNSNPTNQ